MKRDIGSCKNKKETGEGGRLSNLPDELKTMILQKLDVKDNIRLASVSVSWRRFVLETARPQLPWLLFSCTPQNQVHGDQSFGFFSLTDGKTYNVKIPDRLDANIRGARLCYGSLDGWVFMLHDQDSMGSHCFLLNPFSRDQILLPDPLLIRYPGSGPSFPVKEDIFYDVICSCSPLSGGDCIVVAVNKPGLFPLAFCRPGVDLSWFPLEIGGCKSDYLYFCTTTGRYVYTTYGAAFYRGKLHLFRSANIDKDRKEKLCIVDFARTASRDVSRKAKVNVCQVFEPEVETISKDYCKKYLVESQGSLLMVYRYGRRCPLSGMCITFKFLVFKLEESNKNDDPSGATHVWVRQSRLEGDQVLFLGRFCSISVSAAKYPGLKENSIFFAEDLLHLQKYEGMGKLSQIRHLSQPVSFPISHDIGVYHLEDDRIDRHLPFGSYRPVAPPIWIKPPF